MDEDKVKFSYLVAERVSQRPAVKKEARGRDLFREQWKFEKIDVESGRVTSTEKSFEVDHHEFIVNIPP